MQDNIKANQNLINQYCNNTKFPFGIKKSVNIDNKRTLKIDDSILKNELKFYLNLNIVCFNLTINFSKTMSCKIIVTTSAIICPLDISFKACK
jgi:hypothetical protein